MKKANIIGSLDLNVEVISKLSEEEIQQIEAITDVDLETTSFCDNPPFSYIR